MIDCLLENIIFCQLQSQVNNTRFYPSRQQSNSQPQLFQQMNYRNRQLYKQSHFTLPLLQPITYTPFNKGLPSSNQNIDTQVYAINKHQQQQIKPTYSLAYNGEFEIIVGGENMYPLFIDVKGGNLVVCSQECFLVVKILLTDEDASLGVKEKETSFLKSNVKLGVYNKVMLDQPPNCLKTTQNHVYLGMNDGKILCYDITRKSLTGISDDFTLPVMEIQIMGQNEIIAIDSVGNVKHLQFSHKTFMDKIIKTLISARDISVVQKVNKREKFKKLFKSVVGKKQDILASIATNDNSVPPPVSTNPPYPHSNRLSLPKAELKDLLSENVHIFAVVRNSKLSIFTCDQEFQLIQEQILFECQNNEQIGMVQFGIGGFQKSNNTHLLVVFSVGNKLKYFKGVLAEDAYQWMYISQSTFNNKILDGKFISNNLILIVTQQDISLINVTQDPEKIHPYNFSKFEYIEFFIKEEGLNFDPNLITKSIMRTINQKSEFFCLEGKRLLTGKIDSWDTYLQRYVDQEKFNEAMNMSLKIYNRQLKKLSNINEKQEIRNQQMKQFFEKVALTFMSYEIKKQHSNKHQMLSICVDFLVRTQCFQYLFTTIFEIIKSIGLEEDFLKIIDKYVMKGKIKVMTEEIIDLMTKWYKSRNQKHSLEIMIQKFDLTLMQKSLLLIICLKEHLYQSMIYICNQHGDFISPILKLCGIFYTQKLSKEEKTKITEILFFFLKECLLGHNTEFGNGQAYIEMLIQLINFLFIPNTLDMLVGISCKDTIKVVNMFFETKIMQFLLENEGKFFIKKNDYVELKIFEQTCINEFKVYEKMLSTLIFIKDQSQAQNVSQPEESISNTQDLDLKKLSFQVNTFLSYLILKNQFPFQTAYKENAVYFFIQTSSLQSTLFLAIDKENSKISKQIQSNAYFMRLMDSLMRSLQGKQQQKIKSLNLILNKLKASNNELNLMQGQCYVLHQLGRNTDVLRTYLRMENQVLRYKVFSYLEFNLNQNHDLTVQFINSLDVLMSIDPQKTQTLLYGLKQTFACDPETIASNLNSYPDLQLEYIQSILNNNNLTLLESKKNRLSLMHLQIVVKHRSTKLDQYIQKMDYPLEQAFKICQEKNNKIAKAFVLVKSGRNVQGLLLLCDLFLKSCDQLFGLLARKKLSQQQKTQQLYYQLTKLLQSCHKQFQIDSQRGQKIWSKCIKKIFNNLRISQNMRNESIPEPIKIILKRIVEQTLRKMFSQMSPEYFIEKFCKRFPQLPFSVFIIAFGEVYDKMEFYSKLQLLELELQQKDINKFILNLLKRALKSHASRSQCQICYEKLSFSTQKSWTLVTYSCGCFFHKQCVSKNISNENKQNNEKKQPYHICMNNIEKFVELRGIKIQNLKAEGHQQTEIKKRIMKLKDYETNEGTVFELPSLV